jgi:hypothetical protein
MCMAHLTRRMQILLDEDRYRRLEEQAAHSGRSVASVIRDGIDLQLGTEVDARRRLEAGRRFLAEPMPSGYDREPDWEEVEDLEYEEDYRRLYPDDE